LPPQVVGPLLLGPLSSLLLERAYLSPRLSAPVQLFGIFLLSTGSKGNGNCDDTERASKNAKISFTFHSENGSLGRRSKKNIRGATSMCKDPEPHFLHHKYLDFSS